MAKAPKLLDLSKYSLDVLKQLQRDVDEAVKTASERSRKEALAAAQAAAKEHGFTLTELAKGAGKKRNARRARPSTSIRRTRS